MHYHLKIEKSDSLLHPELKNDYDFNSLGSISHIKRYQPIDFSPDIDFGSGEDFDNNDMISISEIMSANLFLSIRLFELLKDFKIFDHQSFQGSIITESKTFTYFLFHFLLPKNNDCLEYIDFTKTTFIAEKTVYPVSIMSTALSEGVLGEFKVKSLEEWQTIRSHNDNDYASKVIYPNQRLYLNNKELLTFDLFIIDFNNWSDSGFIVSERLANALSSSGYTGFCIDELPYEIL